MLKKVENKKTLGEILKKIDQLLGGTTTPQDVTVSEEFQEAMSIWEDSDES
ncbi:hypothetical protein [Streptococcus hyovaginalis]